MTPLYHPRPERWPQVSLRGLLVVMTLAALLTPWATAKYRAWSNPQPNFDRLIDLIVPGVAPDDAEPEDFDTSDSS